MTLPPPTVEAVADPQLIIDALGIEGTVTPMLRYSYGLSHIVVQLPDVKQVSQLSPNYGELSYLGPTGVVVCAVEKPESDLGGLHAGATSTRVRARVFVPGAGIAEDPATGSAVAPIALHLWRQLGDFAATHLTIAQGIELGRPSELRAVVHAEHGQVRQIEVGGDCVILGRGEWHLPGRTSG
jgi:trans-2,3-dihydro-3-hydroxyanthranilate isomerase